MVKEFLKFVAGVLGVVGLAAVVQLCCNRQLFSGEVAQQSEPRFTFKQHVKVAGGFYRGCLGHVVEAREWSDIGWEYRLSSPAVIQRDGSRTYQFDAPGYHWFAERELRPVGELPERLAIPRDLEHKPGCHLYVEGPREPICSGDHDHPPNNVKPLPAKPEVESIEEGDGNE